MPAVNSFCLVDRSGNAMVTMLLSEVKPIPVPPLTPLTVVPDKMGSAPAAVPTVSEFCLPIRPGLVMVATLLSEVKVIPVAPFYCP